MNSRQIENILKRNPKTCATFVKVVPANEIPQHDQYPYAVVINTDQSSEPGTHWVAVYVASNEQVEYFDSYGNIPNSDIGSFMQAFRYSKFHKNKFQSLTSGVCGHYCVYFLVKRCSGQSFEDVVERLRKHENPDKLVYNFTRSLF